jgi:RND family efflux transporter MFP subunit
MITLGLVRLSLIGLLALGSTGCGPHDADNQASAARRQEALPVRVQGLERVVLPRLYPVPGQIVPAHRVQISSRIRGFIRRVAVEEGERVQAGDVLVEIDPTEVRAAIAQARAAQRSARADLADAGADVKRFEQLVSQQALPEDRLRKARLRLQQARAALAQAHAQLKAKEADLAYVEIRSPLRAVVVERRLDPGTLVGIGVPILHLDGLDELRFETHVPAQRAARLSIDQPVTVRLDTHPGPIMGRISHIVHSADPVTRRCKVKIALPADETLLPGAFGKAMIPLGAHPVAVVPVSALVERAGIEGVFIAGPDHRARFRGVRTGRHWGEKRELLAGVDVGERVILAPPPRLHEGDPIRVITDP